MTTGRVHGILDIFEAEIEPKLKIQAPERWARHVPHPLATSGSRFSRGWKRRVAVVYFVHGTWESFVQITVFVVLGSGLRNALLFQTCFCTAPPDDGCGRPAAADSAGGDGWFVWPVRVFLEGAESACRASLNTNWKSRKSSARKRESKRWWKPRRKKAIIEPEQGGPDRTGGGIQRQTSKRGDDAAGRTSWRSPAECHARRNCTLKWWRRNSINIPVYEKSPDDIFGVVYAQDLLHVADQDLPRRKVRELAKTGRCSFPRERRPVSELLREMRQKGPASRRGD